MLIKHPVPTISITAILLGISYYIDFSQKKQLIEELQALQTTENLIHISQRNFATYWSETLSNSKDMDKEQARAYQKEKAENYFKGKGKEIITDWKGQLSKVDSDMFDGVVYYIRPIGSNLIFLNRNEYTVPLAGYQVKSGTKIAEKLLSLSEGSEIRFSGKLQKKSSDDSSYGDIEFRLRLDKVEKW